ncbi:hypothetical protein RhiJN_19829 [Ceratobasidium sp. AG-Ba]|nr:hypothetical protein RhiJN_04997 [Ceratobasidium sp. AG-Ba]QRV91811.1 hypothetical protein RhiJN_19829 [Ceratobasidium sp. AG-Ba]
MDAFHDDERHDTGRRSTSRDSRTARIELAQRRLENALATPNSPSSPWSARSVMGPSLAGHSPSQYQRPNLRSVSFSSEPDHRFPARRTDQPAFPSTFEDDESELSHDDVYFHPSPRRASPSTLLPRPGLYASIGANGLPVPSPDPSGTRSRSQSLATLGRRPMPAHAASYAPSSPLPAPGSQGLPQSWADSRFGIPAPISYARPAPQRQGDISNISPFVRDVGQILHDDFRELWGAERDDGGGSGTTSRRHSVSVVQPRRFVSHTQHHDERSGPGSIDAFAQGRSVISDDDLLGNMLNLDLDDPPVTGRVAPATFNPRGPLAGGAGAGLVSQPSSLPTYPAPLQRHSPVGALGLHEHSPRTSTLEHVPENGTSFQSNQHGKNPSPERDGGPAAGRGFVSRPSLTQLRTDSLRTNASSEQRFSPSLSPNTQRGLNLQAQYGQGISAERGGIGLGLGGMGREQVSVFGREQQQPGAGFAQGTTQHYHSGASPRTSTFPVSPSAMRTSFGPPHLPQTPLSPNTHHTGNPTQPEGDLGRGLPLSALPAGAPLYVVEFKAGRTDLFFTPDGAVDEPIRRGDLVIVEADRGKDLGKVVNDSISLAEVERFMMEGADDGQGGRKEIMPKRIYARAGPADTQLLLSKMQDEVKALQLCQTKIRQKKLPMEVIDAEYQWDRRKLTFYYVADRRIDFRELVRELFR